MSARHHPAEDVLWDYYRGALKPGLALAVRGHLELCPHCRADIGLFDAVGGALLDQAEGVALAGNALDLALARLDRPQVRAAAGPVRKVPAFLDGVGLPEALKAAHIGHRRRVAPGVWLARIDLPDGGKAPTYLLRAPAGTKLPAHTHRGRETTLVLKGSFSDQGHIFEAGDFICRDDDDLHSPQVTADGECICLIAQDAPIVPMTWLARLLQSFGGF